MTNILSAIAWLVVSAVLHILINKLRLILPISRVVILLVFFLGSTGNIITNIWLLKHVPSSIPLPLVSIALNIALALAYISITGSPSLGDESPSSKIVLSLLRNGPQTEKQLLKIFSDEEVIGKRLTDLISSRCLYEKRGMLIVALRGEIIARIFIAFRGILRLTQGG